MDNNYNDSPNLHNVALGELLLNVTNSHSLSCCCYHYPFLDGDDEMEKGTAPVHSAVNPGT